MNDELKKKLEAHRLSEEEARRLLEALPPGVMRMVKDQATAQLLRLMLERFDAKEISADDFVELARAWLERE